jgi:hypothetical protein
LLRGREANVRIGLAFHGFSLVQKDRTEQGK